MSKLFTALAAVAVAGVCSWSQAGITASVTPLTTNVPAGFTGYKITMTSATGVMGGVDFSTTGEVGKAFNLSLHQYWAGARGVYTPSPQMGAYNSGFGDDSYFIFTPGNVTIGAALVEDNSGTGSPSASDSSNLFGVGTTLNGAWAYSAGATSSMDVAYIVVKNGTLPGNGVLATPYATEVVGGSVIAAAPVMIAVPEPTSIALLGLGAMALISRRRRVA